MKDIDSIISMWKKLLNDLEFLSFDDFGGMDFDNELFKEAFKEAYVYFATLLDEQKNNAEVMFTLKESQLHAILYAYSVQIICTASQVSDKCEASKMVVETLCDFIACRKDLLLKNSISITLMDNDDKIISKGSYLIHEGNLDEMIELYKIKYTPIK